MIQRVAITIILVVIVFALGVSFPPVTQIPRQAGARIANFLSALAKAPQLAEQNEDLRTQNARLLAQLQKQADAQEENALLRTALGNEALEPSYQFISANVIAKNLLFGSQSITLNRGQETNIKEGDPVVITLSQEAAPASFALVGQVAKVLPYYSLVLLSNDASFTIDAITGQNALRGVAKGTPGNQLILDEVLQGLPLSVGDGVFTTNNRMQVPKNLFIGKVGTITSLSSDVVQQARIELPYNPYTLTTVGILHHKDT